jgi:hypothetical protein
MKLFICKSIAYVFVLLIITISLLEVSSFIVKSRGFLNYETESNLLFYKSQTEYDILFMGISHARNFSRNTNHIRVEKILNKSIINIGRGGAICGVNEQLFYLDYFYHLKNRTKKVIYIISPPLIFSELFPKASNTFNDEPFELSFLFRYLFFDSENKKERILSYLHSKFTWQWFKNYPVILKEETAQLDSVNLKDVHEGEDFLYGTKELSFDRFEKSKKQIEETINLAKANNSEVILIIVPTAFGKWRGQDYVVDFAKKMSVNNGVEFYDCSEVKLNPEYYSDHHHLNSNGISFFTEHYLKPIINEKLPQKP